jgi:hypothetical protein
VRKIAAACNLSTSRAPLVVDEGSTMPESGEIRGKDGVHCYSPQPACTLVSGDYFIDVDGRAGGLPETEIRQIVDGLDPADLADQDDWVPVEKWSGADAAPA